jgi:uncharacterized protein (DUF2344 family)
MVGKSVSKAMLPYLTGIDVKTAFLKLHKILGITTIIEESETNIKKIEQLEQKIQKLETKLEDLTIENQTLRRVIEYSIPQNKVQDAITRLAKEYDIKVMKESGEPVNLSELIKMIQRLK